MTEDQKVMVALNSMVERLEAEVLELKKELDVNAAMLSRQTDLARQAENERDAAQENLKHAKLVVKAADRELKAERKEVARLRAELKTAHEAAIAQEVVREQLYEKCDKLRALKDYDCPIGKACEQWLAAQQEHPVGPLTR